MDEPADSTGSTITSDDTSPPAGSTIESPTPAQLAAQAWAAAMGQRSQPCVMPPWDEMVWFLEPVVTTYVMPAGQVVQLCQVNPMRVVLGFVTGQLVWILPIQAPSIVNAIRNGIPMTAGAGTPLFTLLQDQHGLLAQCDWYGQASSNCIQTVIELQLRDWPTNRRTCKKG